MPDRIHVTISGPQGAGKSRLEALFVQAMSPECATDFQMERSAPFDGELFVPTADFGQVGFSTVMTGPDGEAIPLPPDDPVGNYKASRMSEIGDLGVPDHVKPLPADDTKPLLPTIDFDRWIEQGRMFYDQEPNDAGMYAWVDWSQGFANYDQQKLIDTWQSFKTVLTVDAKHFSPGERRAAYERLAAKYQALEPTETQMADAIRAAAATFDDLIDQAEKMGIAVSGTVPQSGRFRLSEFKLSIFRPL
jgi:hypothetical protein